MRGKSFADITARGVSEFFEWVKDRSHLFRGITFGTMIRDEGYSFIRLGTFLERADNTARILDAKYHTLLPSVEDVGGAVDYYQWSALLRSVSAFNSYREILQVICDEDRLEPERLAGELHAQLHYGKTERIFKLGLHEYLMQFLEQTGALNVELNKHFLMPTYA
jgi:uncharacterized alpha-E superfamily protein